MALLPPKDSSRPSPISHANTSSMDPSTSSAPGSALLATAGSAGQAVHCERAQLPAQAWERRQSHFDISNDPESLQSTASEMPHTYDAA